MFAQKMYEIRFVYQDYRNYVVQIDGAEMVSFFAAIQEGKPYMDKSGQVGFWLPPEGVRAAFISLAPVKEEKPQEEAPLCQENPSLEQENASIV